MINLKFLSMATTQQIVRLKIWIVSLSLSNNKLKMRMRMRNKVSSMKLEKERGLESYAEPDNVQLAGELNNDFFV